MKINLKVLIILIIHIRMNKARSLLGIIKDKIDSSKSNSNCTDVEEDQLESKLVRMHPNLKDYQYYPPSQLKYEKIIVDSTENLKTGTVYGNTECSMRKQFLFKSDEYSLCPHNFVEVERNDRYPFRIIHAVCNCKKCLDPNSDNNLIENTKCLPNYILKPVLIKNGCLENGYYDWKIALEYVPISCSCKQIRNFD